MKLAISILLTFCLMASYAQDRSEDGVKSTNFPKMRKLVNADIPGAPVLGQPQYLEGTKNEIRVEKHGLIYPAFFDWNKDGKKDLLLGEFETGDTGSFIKVYLNEGSDKKPKYSGEYFYAKDVNGDTITNHQWCCIGIHPRIKDMDGDGYLDILSGQYNPGKISWWRGSEKGFQPRQFIDQEGYVDGKRYAQDRESWSPEAWAYWNYTSADFADFNGDGLLDLFVGGTDGFRVALNVGTKEKPKFGVRKYLHHVNGDVLHVELPDKKQVEEAAKQGRYTNLAGVGKGYMTPVDWDGDGVLDLLVTHEYYKKGHNPIEFYRGVETDKGLRFEQKKALFTEVNGEKAMPGCQPMITVVDYNNDGVNDIVMGISIPTINSYEVVPEVAWEWVKKLKIEMPGKDAGRTIKYSGGIEGTIKRIESDTTGFFKQYVLGILDDYKYLTMRHRGYSFVFYGKKNKKKAVAKKEAAAPAFQRKVIVNEQAKESNTKGPVKYTVVAPQRIKSGKEMDVAVQFNLRKGWYLYADHPANTAAGFIPTEISFDFSSELVEKIGTLTLPVAKPKGGFQVYKDAGITFAQKFKLKRLTREDYQAGKRYPNAVKVKVRIYFQTCNNDMCLPPEEHVEELDAVISMF
ncbi:hypothetical protein EYV94_25530 [Puteibacter caeruleilacunae]|nr:hypothetical protein EYV94_25530 [Puteibacter caeruleilacunae]